MTTRCGCQRQVIANALAPEEVLIKLTVFPEYGRSPTVALSEIQATANEPHRRFVKLHGHSTETFYLEAE